MLNLRSVTWERVRTAMASDYDMQALVTIIDAGMPESKNELLEQLREYFQFRDDLHTIDGVILYKDRIIIPPPFPTRRGTGIFTLCTPRRDLHDFKDRVLTILAWYHPGYQCYMCYMQPL